MSNVIQKCPKDGTEYAADFTGACESCLTPLQFFCKKHDQWLVDDTCNRCCKEGVPAPPPAAVGGGAKTLFSIGIFVVVVLCLLAVGGGSVYLALKSRQAKPVPKAALDRNPDLSPPHPPVSAPTPVTVAPVAIVPPSGSQSVPKTKTVFPEYPPIRLEMSAILVDGDNYVGKLIEVAGLVQLVNAEKRQFVLQQGNNTVEVRCDLASVANGERVIVTGLLEYDDTFSSYFIVAQKMSTSR
jgi:hypothetical protein